MIYLTTMPKKTKPKRTREQQQLSQLIVAKFVPNCASGHWAKQRAMAYKLIEKYPDKDFWVSLPANDEVYSLNYYLCETGLQYLESHKVSREYTKQSFEPMASKPEEKKATEPTKKFEVNYCKKKTRMDFLRGEE